MFGNIVAMLVLLALGLATGWLAWHARRRRLRIVKWGGMGVLGFVSVLALLFTLLVAIGIYQVYSPRGNPVREVAVAITDVRVSRGAEIANGTCAGCHSLNESLPLSGGRDIFEEIPIPLGTAVTPNLTPAGRLRHWTDGEIQRVIREGTSPDGHLMPLMASQNFRVLSQEDLDSIVAYLRSQPEVVTDLKAGTSLSVLAVAMKTLGQLPTKSPPESTEAPPPVAKGPTVEYGAYVAGFIDCALCHSEMLEGGTSNFLPRGPDLISVQSWTQADFIAALRTGVTPDGRQLDPDEMPWESTAKLDNVSLTALYEYVKSAR